MSDKTSTACGRPPCPFCGAEREYLAPGWMVCRNIDCERNGQHEAVGVWSEKSEWESGCGPAAGSAQFALDRREQYLSACFSAARDQRVLGQWRELAETYSKIGREIALAEHDARYLAQNDKVSA